MVLIGPWLGFLIVGAVLLVLAYNVALPPPLNPILKVVGWAFVVVAALSLVLEVLGMTGLVSEPAGALIVIGIVLLILGYNVAMLAPANRLCIIFGWLALALGVVSLLLDFLPRGSRPFGAGLSDMAAGLFFLGALAGPTPDTTVLASQGDPPAGSDGNYKARWFTNVVVTVLLIFINIPTILEKVGWANLGIPDVIANWVLVVSAVAAVVANMWFPNVLQPPTPQRILAEQAVRGNADAGHRLASLARANWRVKT